MLIPIICMFLSMMLSNTILYKGKSINGILGNSLFMSIISFIAIGLGTNINPEYLNILNSAIFSFSLLFPITIGVVCSRSKKEERKVLKVDSIKPKSINQDKSSREKQKEFNKLGNMLENVKNKAVAAEPTKSVTFTRPNFTEKDMAFIKDIESKLSLSDATSITRFGLETQKSFAKLNDQLLIMVQSCLSITLTKNLTDIMEKIQKFDGEDVSIINEIMDDVANIVVSVEEGQDELEKYVSSLSELFVICQDIVKQLDRLVEAGNICLTKDNETLSQLKLDYEKNQDMMVFNEINEIQNNSGRLEKKLSSLQFTKMNAAQFSVQLKSIQNNERHFIDDIYNVIHNIIPIWKSKVSLSYNNQKQKSYGFINDEIKESILDNSVSAVQNDMLDIDIITQLNKSLLNNIESLVKTSTESHKNYNSLFNEESI